MTWIAISDDESHIFSAGGIGSRPGIASLIDTASDGLMCRGSLVIETRLPVTRRPKPLLSFDGAGDWPLHLSLHAVPGGGLILVIDQGGEILHKTIPHSETGRTDILRVTYSWDAFARIGRIALEDTDRSGVVVVPVESPKPLRVDHIAALMQPSRDRYLSPDLLYLALSDAMEPIGPMPGLMPETPIATAMGYRKAGDIRRGDLIISGDGEQVPVLHAVSRTVPAFGSFSPLKIRAPYFGLRRDIRIAPTQRLVLSGSEVEYLFGQESVLTPAQHLVGGTTVQQAHCGPLIRYVQFVLPGHETLIAAGSETESLYIGRLRRKKDRLAASLLAGLDRSVLPEHGRSVFPVLKAFDALVLAEQRAA